MPFEYSSFISWAHADGELGTTFVRSLHAALSQEIELLVRAPVYLDEQRLVGGQIFESAIASAMCQSATWVLVFTPRYHEQEFCRREKAAMETLEQRRRAALGERLRREDGLIIPVVFRGDDDEIPDELRRSRHYLDFRRFTLVDPDISRNAEYVTQVGTVASHIARLARLDPDGAHDCATFELPPAPPDGGARVQEFPGHPRGS